MLQNAKEFLDCKIWLLLSAKRLNLDPSSSTCIQSSSMNGNLHSSVTDAYFTALDSIVRPPAGVKD